MLVITRRSGESFMIGSNIEVIISDVSRDSVRISIDAPKEIPILRKELIEATNTNRQACRIIESSTLIALKNNMTSNK